MDGIVSMTQTGERLASSLMTQSTPTVSTQCEDDDETAFLIFIGKKIKSWSPKDKRKLVLVVLNAYSDMAEAIEARQQPAPTAAVPQQHVPLHHPGPSWQQQPQLDHNQPGPSWANPQFNQHQQPGHVSYGTTQYDPSVGAHQQHRYQLPSPGSSAMAPSWRPQHQPWQGVPIMPQPREPVQQQTHSPVDRSYHHQRSPVGPVQPTTTVQLLPPRSPSPGAASHPLNTSTEDPFTLTRVLRDYTDGLSADPRAVYTDLQSQGNK